jgi:ERF superfamily
MKTSESIKLIATALLKAQQEMTFASKGATNPHFKSKYADLPSVIDAVKSPLNDAGIVFLQTPSPSDDGRLHLTTRLIHSSGEWIEDTATCPLPKQDPQGFGSALTYLRRYSLAAICGLYQDDDDGNGAVAVNTISPNILKDLIKSIEMAGNLDSLRNIYIDAVVKVNGEQVALKSLEITKDKRKAELTAGSK